MTLEELGFSNHDLFLFIICPILGGLVGLFKGASKINPLDGDAPKVGESGKTSLKQADWVMGWCIWGALSGLLIACLFLGAIKPDPGSLGRVMALAMFAGYLGPQLWSKQEKTMLNLIDKKLKNVELNERDNDKNES
ncbi:hypothetical protein KO533_16460 [Shewanella sp. NKUCC05_KAH]|uniref:hypothetical protein n=1 Tax=Shewanella sp. NKUCC05_KAH TaxID=2842126 RepID=UPI001C5BCC14|nr:hypothetical protein [Shewanella sp. NKUCC05_KAH]MBW3528142.1 hypothetical protein [Shewanella sp. NKUCC05_KAH]